ncbi:MAG: hypothetical protein ABEI52_02440 [Halobacteriaceae archaeon]
METGNFGDKVIDWATREFDTPHLNLGCGSDYHENAINVDINKSVAADVYVDLQHTPWPWKHSTFELIEAHHILEHLDPVPWDELNRVLKPNGILDITYPIGHTRFEDPTHSQYWNVNTAEMLVGNRKHGHEAPLSDFVIVSATVEWSIPHRIRKWRTKWKVAIHGPGPWMGQVPGLYGEVHVIYRKTIEEEHGDTP